MLPAELESLRDSIRGQVEALGAELLDLRYRRQGPRGVLTVIVDKEAGVTLQECARINEGLGRFFDELEGQVGSPSVLRSSYDLEVASPGLDRPFAGEKDYRRAIGKLIRVRLTAQPGRPDLVIGRVTAVDAASVTLETAKAPAVTVAYDQIAKATLEITF